MENNFKELYSTITKQYLNTFVDVKNNLLLYQPLYLLAKNKWQIIPNTNEAYILNSFYNQYPEGVEGTKKECLNLIKKYKNGK